MDDVDRLFELLNRPGIPGPAPRAPAINGQPPLPDAAAAIAALKTVRETMSTATAKLQTSTPADLADNYASAKSIAKGLLDTALLASNLAIIRTVTSGNHKYKTLLLVWAILSIVLSALSAVISIALYAQNPDVVVDVGAQDTRKRYGSVTSWVNNFLIVLSLLSLIANGVLASFAPKQDE